MERSSIYADLRKLAGGIKPKVVLESNATIENNTISKNNSALRNNATIENKAKAPVTSPPEITIDMIAAKIKPPMIPLRDNNGFVHDAATIAVKCSRGHIHKYYLKDINADGGIEGCITCTSGNKFMMMVREIAETTLGVPFIISDKRLNTDGSTVEFTNPVLKITLATTRVHGHNTAEIIGDNIVLRIHPTVSIKKVKDTLRLHLSNYPRLCEEQRDKIKALGAVEKKIVHQKKPLPFTPELANIHARTKLNVVLGKELYLENC